jgi:uncharacterized protein
VSPRPDVPDSLRVRRQPKRGHYDRETIDAILDEALYCHLGFAVDGQPFVIPTLHARVGDRLYVHGSAASRTLRHAAGGARVCVTVTLLDGLVLAKSVFNHSLNNRSVVVLGAATAIDDDEKLAALHAFAEHVAPGRWSEAREPSAKELKSTWIVSLPLDEASAKVRSGPPEDEPEDLDLPFWSGVVPIHLAAGASEYGWQRVRNGTIGAPPTRHEGVR